MTKLYPLPSPNGTNYENLRLPPLGAAAAAFDAAPRRARDADPDPDAVTGAMSALQTHLKSKLSGDDLAAANGLLSQLLELVAPQDPDDSETDEDEPAEDRRRKMAGDGRTRFPTQDEINCVAGMGSHLGRRGVSRMSADAYRRTADEMAKLFPTAVTPKQYG